MKVVALALTILLVAGTQARSLQADAPSPLQHVRSAALLYLQQVKETAQKALVHLDDTEFKDHKAKISETLDKVVSYIEAGSAQLAPTTDAFATQALELTAGLRETIRADIDELQKTLAPKREELRQVLRKHLDEYREKLEPIVTEYQTKHKEELEALKLKLEPVVQELRARVEANVEETKSKLVPIIEAIRSKLSERLEEIKTLVAPYVEEYREQLIHTFTELREQLAKNDGLSEELKTKLYAVYETLSKAVTKA